MWRSRMGSTSSYPWPQRGYSSATPKVEFVASIRIERHTRNGRLPKHHLMRLRRMIKSLVIRLVAHSNSTMPPKQEAQPVPAEEDPWMPEGSLPPGSCRFLDPIGDTVSRRNSRPAGHAEAARRAGGRRGRRREPVAGGGAPLLRGARRAGDVCKPRRPRRRREADGGALVAQRRADRDDVVGQ